VECVTRQLRAAPTLACSVNLADFMIPASVGSAAGLIAGFIARALMDGERDGTKDAAAQVMNSAAFLFFGGLTFILRQRRPH
jgi:hypothetical protein